MSKRTDIITAFYGGTDEDGRLSRSRHGQLEYLTTMHYICRYAPKGSRILEVGAGTGRYSIALAREGYDVTAVELVESNLSVLRQKAEGIGNLRAHQGDATDLSRFGDGAFDVTLLLGPMYHLYDPGDVHRALDEAIRVTKKGGVILTAFLSVHAILFNNYLNSRLLVGLAENFDDKHYVRHYEEQLFTGYDIAGFEALFADKAVQHLTTAATDSILELAEERPDFALSDEAFAAFAEHHLATCELRELLGCSSHLLHICKKGE